ncbi:MAG: short-chain dehydrogenase [Planctomycetota bacterium]|nr:MAG: short-chain dehydrogenase [Planctomycetota bacterium]
MSGKLSGKVAWISGGASGMGEATASLFADEGAAVAIVDIQRELGETLTRRINDRGGRATFIECDVQREQQVARSIEATVAAFGSPSIVVNCAGIVHVKQLHEYSEAEWDELMGVNVKSIFFSIKHGLAHLTKQPRSYMVNIGSIGSFIGQANTPAYTTSKGAVLQLSRSIALDYAALGLRCNCVCPGITDTPMLRYHMSKASDPAGALAERLRRVPMGTALSSHDVAKAMLYLSCEDSSGVTGASLVIDGGYLAAAEWQSPPRTAFMDP